MGADRILVDIADYVCGPPPASGTALDTALLCLADSLGCAIRALEVPECRAMLGPVVDGTVVPGGVPVPGTNHIVDPEKAAFDIGTMIRWLDYNDTWLAAEWGHPSDNIGAIIAAAVHSGDMTVKDILPWIIMAYEIQGGLALENSFNRVGLDHVILVKIASAAVCARILGADPGQVQDVVSNAFVDAGPLRSYRHYPNAGSRKSWAAGDASSRGIRLAMMVLRGAMGYPTALSTPIWGFEDALFGGKPLKLGNLGSYVMENILFKVSYPAEFHAQTAVEAGVELHSNVADRIADIQRIEILSQEAAIRIIDKKGPLANPAARDHCLQYMTACGLLYGDLTPAHYTDESARDPCIDQVRNLMIVREEPRYSRDYLDPDKRSIANAVQVFFADGTSTPRVEVEYPIGHPRRREEAIPLLYDKLRENVSTLLGADRAREIAELFSRKESVLNMRIRELLSLFRPAP